MAQLVDSSKSSAFQNSPASSFKTPPSQPSPTFEQLVQGDGTITQSPATSGKHNDYEGGEPTTNRKSSVLNKVREKAKKLRHTLSNKRIRQSNIDSEYDRENEHDNDNENEDFPDTNTIRSLDVNLDEDEPEEDPEYLGAPIYESEKAPEECKEIAQQHPREVTASAEKHVIESCAKNDARKDDQGPTQSSKKTLTESVSGKLAPAYNAISDATHSIAAKIHGLTVETPETAGKKKNDSYGAASSESTGQGRNTSPHTYDKGVSVKEYLMQKFEPGEDEKALSKVISEAISPRRTGEQVGMVGMMKDAVTSFLQPSSKSQTKAANSSGENTSSTNQNSSSNKTFTASKTFNISRDPSSADTNADSLPQNASNASKMKSKSCSAATDTKLSSFIPISTNSQEDTKAEDSGRILQAN